jgi:hypothetical protein
VRRFVAALTAAVCLISIAAAGASGPAPATVHGIELAATATRGTFAGKGRADGAAVAWQAVVNHERLHRGPAAITSGSFRMARLSRAHGAGVVAGRFAGGTITPVSQAAGCGRQVYAVDGELTLSGGGTGTVSIRLTHLRKRIFGRCLAYAASVAGTIALTA